MAAVAGVGTILHRLGGPVGVGGRQLGDGAGSAAAAAAAAAAVHGGCSGTTWLLARDGGAWATASSRRGPVGCGCGWKDEQVWKTGREGG